MRFRRHDEDLSEKITLLDNQALKLAQDKKYREAIAILTKTLQLIKQNVGQMSTEYAEHITSLGTMYGLLAEYQMSEQYFDAAIDVFRKVMGESHPEYIMRLKQILTLEISYLKLQLEKFYEQHLYTEAMNTAKMICEKILQLKGENDPDYINSLYNLAMIYRESYDYTNAEKLYKLAMHLRQRTLGEDNIDFAHALFTLAGLYSEKNEYDKAEPLYQKLLTIIDSISGQENVYYANGLNALGEMYFKSAKYDKAEPLYQKALEIRHKVLGENNPDYAQSLNNLALLYKSMSEYSKAEPLYQKALEVGRQTLGENHPYYVIGLNNLAGMYSTIGEYSKAEPLYQKALEVGRQTLGENHPDYVTTLNGLAGLYYQTGHYSKAEPLYQKILEVGRQTLGDNNPQYNMLLEQTLSTQIQFLELRFQGFYKKRLLEESLNISKIICEKKLQLHGERSIEYIGSLYNLAMVYRDLYDYANAETLYKRAIDITQTLGDNIRFAVALFRLAGLYSEKNEYSRADELCQKALKIIETTLGKENVDYAKVLNKTGENYVKWGKYEIAESYLKEAAKIRSRVVGQSDVEFADSLNALGVLYRIIGEYDKAERHMYGVLRILADAPKDNNDSIQLRNSSLINLVTIKFNRGDYRSALNWSTTALTMWEDAVGENHPQIGGILGSIGVIYRTMGDFSKAEQYLNRALEVHKVILGGENHPLFASSLINLGDIYLQSGDFSRAEQYLNRALEIQKVILGEDHPDLFFCLHLLSKMYAATDRKQEAVNVLTQCIAIDDKFMEQIFSFASEKERSKFLLTLLDRTSHNLSLIVQHLSNFKPAICLAFDVVLKRKAIGLDFLNIERHLLASKDTELRMKLINLIRVEAQISSLNRLGIEINSINYENMKHLYLQKDLLEREVVRKIPKIKGKLGEQLGFTDRSRLAESLNDGDVLIEFIKFYHIGEYHYLAFMLFAQQPNDVQMLDLGNANVIDRMINGFRTSITGEEETRSLDTGINEIRNLQPLTDDNKSTTRIGEYGSKLLEAVLGRFLSSIVGKKRLLIAPDGDLTRLPFECLPLNDDGKYIIDEYLITYLTTARDMRRFNESTNKIVSSPLILADPDFDFGNDLKQKTVPERVLSTDNTEPEGFLQMRSHDLSKIHLPISQLPGTRQEGEAIAQLLSVDPKMGANAHISTIAKAMSPYVLHIATHGFFLPNELEDQEILRDLIDIENLLFVFGDNKFREHAYRKDFENPLLRSGLILAGANTWFKSGIMNPEAGDGILNAQDAAFLELSNTELVVLSACDTGIGDVHYGEGVFGLRRAFVLAGAQTLVMSLWKVPDEQTKELMVDFYKRLLSGKPRDEALREAQLAMKEKYPDNPYYWGAFICQGNPGPLSYELLKSIQEKQIH